MKRALAALIGGIAVAAWLACAPSLRAAEPPPPNPGLIAGHTLNAVAFVPQNTPGRGELARIMLQAYLRPDGRALVRFWDTARNRYSPAAERGWSLSGKTLCLELPSGAAAASVCAEVHVWGPRIAGLGTQPYAMLDGDLQPGNAIGGR